MQVKKRKKNKYKPSLSKKSLANKRDSIPSNAKFDDTYEKISKCIVICVLMTRIAMLFSKSEILMPWVLKLS